MPRNEAPAPPAVTQRWAVLIGISDYHRDSGRFPDLNYAHRDAEEFAAFLKSKASGSFPPDHVRLLVNEQATATSIREALFEFLKHTVKEDLVLIFFAGHGLPDPGKPSNLYLIAHDSDATQIAATGIPMWDVEAALTRTIAAERVVNHSDSNDSIFALFAPYPRCRRRPRLGSAHFRFRYGERMW
jgi:uncharacterized caspase-like protein